MSSWVVLAVAWVVLSFPAGVVVGVTVRAAARGGDVGRKLITGPVLYGSPRILEDPRTCDRCGLARRGWSWWAGIFRPGVDGPLGEACADCHSLPGGAEGAQEEPEADAPTMGVE